GNGRDDLAAFQGRTRGRLLPHVGSREVRRDRTGQQGACRQVLRLLRGGLRRGRAHRAGEGADRARCRARGAVPVLHRRLQQGVPRKGIGPRADDRSGARRLRDPRRLLARPRRPDDEPRQEGRDVTTDGPAAEVSPRSTTSLHERRSPLASTDAQREILRGLDLADAEGGRAEFARAVARRGWAPLRPAALELFQLNVGRLCNMTCRHCHVDAGPDRVAENMDRATMELCLAALDRTTAHTVDITGGAPELNPHFRWLVDACAARGKHVIDRCNLTVLLLPRFSDLPEWLRARRVADVRAPPP